VLRIIDMRADIRVYAGPGHFNDFDMLEVGNGMSLSEDRAHFSMWAMLASPLIAGNDLRTMSADTRAILTNREVIAVNQDKLGIQAFKYSSHDKLDAWFKPLENGDWAMALLNREDKPKIIAFNWKRETVRDDHARRNARFDKTVYRIRDLWKHEDLGTTKDILNAVVPGHDILILRLSKK
jgi:alpha-galactosidase